MSADALKQTIDGKNYANILAAARRDGLIDAASFTVGRAVLSDGRLGTVPATMSATDVENALTALVDAGLVVRDGVRLRRDNRKRRQAAAKSVDVIAIWRRARADNRLDQSARRIIAQIARVGYVEKPQKLAYELQIENVDVHRSLSKLRRFDYIPDIPSSKMRDAEEVNHANSYAA